MEQPGSAGGNGSDSLPGVILRTRCTLKAGWMTGIFMMFAYWLFVYSFWTMRIFDD
jgi:hypothetical protein